MAEDRVQSLLATFPAAGAVGFSVRDLEIYVFKVRAVVCALGGATNTWRPHAVGEILRGSHSIGRCVNHNWLTLG